MGRIDRQLLKPKDIYWNRSKHTFSYQPSENLDFLRRSLRNERMRGFARTLSDSLQALTVSTDAVEIADYLEHALAQIEGIPVEENVALQREKLQIRRVFLLEAAKVIREMHIEPILGVRNLTAQHIKSFIVEVYIKQQLLGYWFRPLLKRQSVLMRHPIFRYFLLKEQKVRHFYLVKTAEFIFIVAPVIDPDQNPYSIRRFLMEEQGALPEQVFLNILVLDLRLAEENTYIDDFKTQMERMISIRSQVHLDVLEIVDQLEEVCEQHLIPLLVEPLQFVAKNADVVMQMHLKNFETILTNEFFKLIHIAVKDQLAHIEEFDYLYLNVHRLYSELLSYFREFKEQPALIFSQVIQQLEYKLLGYLKLIEKHRESIFVPLNQSEWRVMHQRALKPMQDIQDILSAP